MPSFQSIDYIKITICLRSLVPQQNSKPSCQCFSVFLRQRRPGSSLRALHSHISFLAIAILTHLFQKSQLTSQLLPTPLSNRLLLSTCQHMSDCVACAQGRLSSCLCLWLPTVTTRHTSFISQPSFNLTPYCHHPHGAPGITFRPRSILNHFLSCFSLTLS